MRAAVKEVYRGYIVEWRIADSFKESDAYCQKHGLVNKNKDKVNKMKQNMAAKR